MTDATERRLRTFHERYRDPFSAVGLLVVEQVIRGGRGEAAGLEVGDVLTDLGRGAVPFPDFDGLEAFLDGRLGAQLTLVVERAGRRVDVDVPAGAECLHRLNPATFLEFGGGVLHALSLGAARNGNLDIRSGVYVAFAGFVLDTAGVPAHSVVVALGDEPTPDVEAFEHAAAKLRDGQRVTVRFYNIGDQYNEQITVVRVNRRWFKRSPVWTSTTPLGGGTERENSRALGHIEVDASAFWTTVPLWSGSPSLVLFAY